MSYLRLLLLLILTTTIYSNNDTSTSPFDYILGIHLDHPDHLSNYLNSTDVTYLLYYYKPDNTNSQIGAQYIRSVADKLQFLASVLLVNCDNESFADVKPCSTEGFPKMTALVPPEYRINPYTKEMNNYSEVVFRETNVTETSIYNFVTRNIISRTTKLTFGNIDNFLSNFAMNKVILFTDKDKSPLLYRGLSNFFYDQLSFGEVNKDQKDLLKRFNVKKFPTLIIHQSLEDGILLDEPRTITYEGNINARDIAIWLRDFALEQKLYLHKGDLKYRTTYKNLKLDEYINYMKKLREKDFIIYLSSDDNDDNFEINEFNKQTHGFFHFIKINCKHNIDECKHEFTLSDIPSLLLIKYNNNNNVEDRVKEAIELPLVLDDISTEIMKEYQSNLRIVTPQTFPQLTQEVIKEGKVPVIYLYENVYIINIVFSKSCFVFTWISRKI